MEYKMGQMMEWDSEDVPISNEEGNKRQCSNSLTFKVSNGQDSVEVGVDSSGHNYQISMAASGQASREQ
ncbi:hypothetical protein EPI10_025228 [Gossypium australe]|uniref:Uncharacterized protein n=1 Tax=Gossypium australe TaxID=47621 RepID=A0A5B6W1K5_9ROSI|nr:hypothetical protein EPI10_025228 [Gossypium australe]